MWSVISGPAGDALAFGLGEPDGLDEGEVLGVGVGVGVGVGLGLGVGEADFPEVPGEPEALGLGDGVGRSKASTQLKPLLAGHRIPEAACETG
ncbi:MAG: hypothetical protein HKL92_00255 [Candidatus Eremiobacteraeota bacterium]|nr:hypothetical protein [Candidatus Eremiobacteraeota bacterium]NNM91750.1 hypothetical protein [Candidatus Eremiobacteraeota bacterium]